MTPNGPSQSEVFRYGGTGTVLLLGLLLYVGLHPLMLGGLPARLLGGGIVVIILVAGTMTASRSPLLRIIGFVLAVLTFKLQLLWLSTSNTTYEALMMASFAVFC